MRTRSARCGSLEAHFWRALATHHLLVWVRVCVCVCFCSLFVLHLCCCADRAVYCPAGTTSIKLVPPGYLGYGYSPYVVRWAHAGTRSTCCSGARRLTVVVVVVMVGHCGDGLFRSTQYTITPCGRGHYCHDGVCDVMW